MISWLSMRKRSECLLSKEMNFSLFPQQQRLNRCTLLFTAMQLKRLSLLPRAQNLQKQMKALNPIRLPNPISMMSPKSVNTEKQTSLKQRRKPLSPIRELLPFPLSPSLQSLQQMNSVTSPVSKSLSATLQNLSMQASPSLSPTSLLLRRNLLYPSLTEQSA